MAINKRCSVVSLFLSIQKKILQALLHRDINKNKKLFEKLARL